MKGCPCCYYVKDKHVKNNAQSYLTPLNTVTLHFAAWELSLSSSLKMQAGEDELQENKLLDLNSPTSQNCE